MNAILNKNSADVKGCTIYQTSFPCSDCTKMIIQARIKEVVYLDEKDKSEFKDSEFLLKTCGITIR